VTTGRESLVERQIAIAVGRAGYPLWRNNQAEGWVGEYLGIENGILRLLNPRRLHAGLATGASDRIGIGPGGRFLSIEVKASTDLSEKQRAWLAMVRARGGIAGVARSVEDALAIVMG
jgi:hypothetical protein